MKKLVILATVGIISLISVRAFAEGHRDQCQPGKIFTDDINLSVEQQDLLAELKAGHNDKMKHGFDDRISWMEDFVNGKMNRADIHAALDQKHGKRVKEALERQDLIFDLLDSYSEEQKDQVLDNLEEQEDCHRGYGEASERKRHYEDDDSKRGRRHERFEREDDDDDDRDEYRRGRHEREEYSKGKGKHGGPAKMLFKDMDLSSDQETQLREMRETKKDMHEKGKGNFHRELMEDILSEKVDREEARQIFAKKSGERLLDVHEQVDQMADFLETLSESQKTQLLENIDQLEERMKRRQEYRERESE